MPSANLGQLGRQQGEAAGFDWKWYYSAAGWLIWAALILAFAAPKDNRNMRILLLLIPLLIVNLLWRFFMNYANMNSTDALEFGIIFNSTAVAVTILWLIANSFARFGGAVRFLLCFVTLLAVAALGTLSYSTEFSNEVASFLFLFVFIALTMLVAMTISRRFCGGKYRPVCFMLWLSVWILLGSLVAVLGLFIVMSLIFSMGPVSFLTILMFIVAGSVFGLFLYVLNLPFLILGFAHPFYRNRFCACLGLKPMPGNLEQAGTGLMNAQKPRTEIPEKGDSA